jgi:nitrogenase molybdenum-iron protein beta chain
MHSGPGCAANFSWTQNGAAGLAVGDRCAGLSVPGSNLQETEVVFGGHDRLHEQIRHTLEIMDGDLYFVLTGCVPEVIGDDVESVVREFAGAGAPVISASTAGFKGSSYFGYEQVLKALFKNVVKAGAPRRANLVNVWGLPPMMDVFWKGNLKGTAGLLALLGFETNAFFGPEAAFSDIENAAGARLNIVLSDLYGLEAAELFKERHGVDFITTPPPFGAAASERFLETVGAALGLRSEKIAAIVRSEGERHYRQLEPLLDVYNDMEAQRYAITIGDANYAFAVADFLADDMGWLPELVIVTDDLQPEARTRLMEKRRARGLAEPARVLFEPNGAAAAAAIDDDGWRPENWKKYHNGRLPAFVVGSSLDRGLAAALGAGHLSLSFPVSNRAVISRGYTGYDGGLVLMEDVISALIGAR